MLICKEDTLAKGFVSGEFSPKLFTVIEKKCPAGLTAGGGVGEVGEA